MGCAALSKVGFKGLMSCALGLTRHRYMQCSYFLSCLSGVFVHRIDVVCFGSDTAHVHAVFVLSVMSFSCFCPQDESRKDLYLGTSYAGVFARYLDGQPTVYYRYVT